MNLKQEHLRNAPGLDKVLYDNKLDVVQRALGLHTAISRVQGGKLKAKKSAVAHLFQDAAPEFLRMIVVHELTLPEGKQYNKAFYQLCQYMPGLSPAGVRPAGVPDLEESLTPGYGVPSATRLSRRRRATVSGSSRMCSTMAWRLKRSTSACPARCAQRRPGRSPASRGEGGGHWCSSSSTTRRRSGRRGGAGGVQVDVGCGLGQGDHIGAGQAFADQFAEPGARQQALQAVAAAVGGHRDGQIQGQQRLACAGNGLDLGDHLLAALAHLAVEAVGDAQAEVLLDAIEDVASWSGRRCLPAGAAAPPAAWALSASYICLLGDDLAVDQDAVAVDQCRRWGGAWATSLRALAQGAGVGRAF